MKKKDIISLTKGKCPTCKKEMETHFRVDYFPCDIYQKEFKELNHSPSTCSGHSVATPLGIFCNNADCDQKNVLYLTENLLKLCKESNLK